MASLAELYSARRTGIVAFAPRYPHLYQQGLNDNDYLRAIFGTGLIVGDSIIATNRHVAEVFKELPRPPDCDHIPVVALFFIKTPGGLGLVLLNVCEAGMVSGHKTTGFDYRTQSPDLAVVSVSCTGLLKFAFTLADNYVSAGTEIATAGFPMGGDLLAPRGKIERFGPVLQKGIVAAESPFGGIVPHGYLIDVMVQGGASGSPVFQVSDGRVIGVVFARQPDLGEAWIGESSASVSVPTNFSYVVPSRDLVVLIRESKTRLEASIPHNCPSIDEILASMPQEPVEQMTSRIYRRNVTQEDNL